MEVVRIIDFEAIVTACTLIFLSFLGPLPPLHSRVFTQLVLLLEAIG
jgi:hypothetical protein